MAFDGSGRAYATWIATNGTGPSAAVRRRLAVRDPGAAGFGPERSAPNLVTPLSGFGANRMLGLDEHSRGRRLVSLRARYSRPDGSFGRPDTISTHVPFDPPSLAVHGDAIAAWIQIGKRGRRIVRAAIRRPGHRFGPPVTLRARGRARDVVVAAGAGVVFVAWERAGEVEARVRVKGRGGWGPVQRLGRAVRGGTSFAATVSADRGYLAWMTGVVEAGDVSVAVLPVARTRFRAKQVVDQIEPFGPGEDTTLAIVPLQDRGALLSWSDRGPAGRRVRTAVTGPGSRFGPPADLSPPGEQAVLGDVAAGTSAGPNPLPAAMILWSSLDAVGELGDRVRASLRTPGQTFLAAEDVSDLDRARLPDVSFDHSTRSWTAVWSQRIGLDVGVPQAQITTFLRSSTRPG